MTIQSFFKTAGTVSLKTLRVLWGCVSTLVAAIAYVLSEAFEHASAADDDDPTCLQKNCRDAAEYDKSAASYNYSDGW